MQSSEKGNCCAPWHGEEVIQTQTVEDRTFDCDSQLPNFKCENEQSDPTALQEEVSHFNNHNYCGAEALGTYPIKKEPEDSQCDIKIHSENDVVLQEEKTIIEDRKFDYNSELPQLKRENEQTDPTLHKLSECNNFNYGDDAFPAYPIKKELKTEDSQCDVEMLPKNDLVLKEEEADIEEHKLRWELTGMTSRSHGDTDQLLKEVYKCKKCGYETRKKDALIQHYRYICKDSQETELFKCREFSFQTRGKSDLVQHNESTHTKVYSCPECSYQTKYRYLLIPHHKNKHSTVTELYKCEECSFTTKYKAILTQHYKHKHSPEVQLFKCEECSFQTAHKNHLSQHYEKKHSKMYKCRECSYETKKRSRLTEHHKHKHSKDPEVHKCQECSYETKYKRNLTRHFKFKHSKQEGKMI